MTETKKALINEVLLSLAKDFGEGIILNLNTGENANNATIPSNIGKLDDMLGGGFALGRVLELYGKESVGKTTFALRLAATVQKRGGLAAFIDVEHTFNREYAASLGLDESLLWVAEPYSAEEALMICEKLIGSKLFDIVVLDSVAALSPEIESDEEEEDSCEWLQANLLSQALRRIIHKLRDSKTLAVFINQVRFRPTTSHFEGETTPGGMALKFFADYRLKLCLDEDDFVLAKAPKF